MKQNRGYQAPDLACCDQAVDLAAIQEQQVISTDCLSDGLQDKKRD
ncbi:MAG TPA: hypothetical protein VIM80_02355 [Brevefilum sp.]